MLVWSPDRGRKPARADKHQPGTKQTAQVTKSNERVGDYGLLLGEMSKKYGRFIESVVMIRRGLFK